MFPFYHLWSARHFLGCFKEVIVTLALFIFFWQRYVYKAVCFLYQKSQ